MQSFVDLIQTLPVGDQEKIKEEILVSNNNPEEIEEIMKKYFSETQRTKAVQLATKNAMIDYFKEIDISLSPTQRQKIAGLFQEFNSNV